MTRWTAPCFALAAAIAACSGPSVSSQAPAASGPAAVLTGTGGTPPPGEIADRVEVPAPPFTEGMFPCSACHAGMAVNRTRRELSEMHTEIVLGHDEEHRWCLDCHDAENRDSLHLAGGELVPFEQSYLLCGQCHGDKLRDWKAGVHGRRSGAWNGHKTYLLCAHCHNPHQPRFAPIAPRAGPRRPAAPAWRD